MTVIVQDDHPTAGMWAACEQNKMTDREMVFVIGATDLD